MQIMGKLIVIEGLDGSGKATQAELLSECLKEKGYGVYNLDLPFYSDSSGIHTWGLFHYAPKTTELLQVHPKRDLQQFLFFHLQLLLLFQKLLQLFDFQLMIKSKQSIPFMKKETYLSIVHDIYFNHYYRKEKINGYKKIFIFRQID